MYQPTSFSLPRRIFAVSLILSLFATLLPAQLAQAAPGINDQIPFDGSLKTAAGAAVADGDYDMVFRLYDAGTGGSLLWTGTHSAGNGNAVSVVDGLFRVMLGSGAGNTLAGVDFNDDSIYVGVSVEADPEMSPRYRLGAAAYAFNSDTLDGFDSSDFALATGDTTFASSTTFNDASTFNGTTTVTNGLVIDPGVPAPTTNTLYNNGGTLFWNGAEVGGVVNTLNNIGNVAAATTTGSLLYWNGSAWDDIATSSLGIAGALTSISTTSDSFTYTDENGNTTTVDISTPDVLPGLSQAEIDALTGLGGGETYFNTDTKKIQYYNGPNVGTASVNLLALTISDGLSANVSVERGQSLGSFAEATEITEAGFRVRTSSGASDWTIRLRSGNGLGGAILAEETVSSPDLGSFVWRDINATFTTPPVIPANQEVTLTVTPISGNSPSIARNSTNPYPNGQDLASFNGSTRDLLFSISALSTNLDQWIEIEPETLTQLLDNTVASGTFAYVDETGATTTIDITTLPDLTVTATTTSGQLVVSGDSTLGGGLSVAGNTTLATTTASQVSLSDSLVLASTTPVTTTDALYNQNGALYWNGTAVGLDDTVAAVQCFDIPNIGYDGRGETTTASADLLGANSDMEFYSNDVDRPLSGVIVEMTNTNGTAINVTAEIDDLDGGPSVFSDTVSVAVGTAEYTFTFPAGTTVTNNNGEGYDVVFNAVSGGANITIPMHSNVSTADGNFFSAGNSSLAPKSAWLLDAAQRQLITNIDGSTYYVDGNNNVVENPDASAWAACDLPTSLTNTVTASGTFAYVDETGATTTIDITTLPDLTVTATTTSGQLVISGDSTLGGGLSVAGNTTLATTTASQVSLSDSLVLASTTPVTTTDALYNQNGALYWNGTVVGLDDTVAAVQCFDIPNIGYDGRGEPTTATADLLSANSDMEFYSNDVDRPLSGVIVEMTNTNGTAIDVTAEIDDLDGGPSVFSDTVSVAVGTAEYTFTFPTGTTVTNNNGEGYDVVFNAVSGGANITIPLHSNVSTADGNFFSAGNSSLAPKSAWLLDAAQRQLITNIDGSTYYVDGNGNVVENPDASAWAACDLPTTLINTVTASGTFAYVDETGATTTIDITTLPDLTVTATTTSGQLVISGDSTFGGGLSVAGNTTLATTTLAAALLDSFGTAGTAGQILETTATGTRWVTSEAGVTAFDDLSDVTLSGLADGQVLRYNGSEWNATSDLIIDGSGNIAIGTTSAAYTTSNTASGTPSQLTLAGGFTQVASTPVKIGGVDAAGNVSSVYISGSYAYVGTAGADDLEIFDISDPINPVKVGGAAASNNVTGVHVSGKYAYVSTFGTQDLQIFDVSDPTDPVLTGGIDAINTLAAIYVSGQYAYAGSYSGTLEIFDVSDPTTPVLVGSVAAGDIVYSLAVKGNYAYAGSGFSGDDFEIFDISDPTNPVKVGGVETSDTIGAVAVSGRYAYIGSGVSGDDFEIFDISDPTNPVKVGGADAASTVGSIAVSGRYAYVGTAAGGVDLEIFDISDPTNPILLEGVQAASTVTSVVVDGQYAYVGSSVTGDDLEIFDLGGLNTFGATIGSLRSDNINISENAQVGNNLYVANGLNVGASAVISGALSVAGNTTLATTTASQVSLSDSLVLASTTPVTTTDALYNQNGTLYWNGAEVGGSETTTQLLNTVTASGTFAYVDETGATTTVDLTTLPTLDVTGAASAGTLAVENTVSAATDWTARAAAEANNWQSVIYADGQYVAVSESGTNRVMTSPDGITWTARSAVASGWQSVTYGNGLYVAVADSGSNRVMTSPDGITWTARSAAEQNGWYSVTYGNGLFVALSINGFNRVMTSPDGINWTSRSAADSSLWYSVTYGNGQFVAGSLSGTNRVMTSPDGINWTIRTAAEFNNWRSIVYADGQYVAVADTGTNRVMTSPDGITWTARAAVASDWQSVIYANDQFVAVADGGTNRVMTSPDGITWTAHTAAEANGWRSVAHADGQFVAVSDTGVNRVMTSPDGTSGTLFSANTSANDSIFTITNGGQVGIGTSTDLTNALNIAGGVTLADGTPAATTDALYNNGGTLFFNGSEIGGGVVDGALTFADGTIQTTAAAPFGFAGGVASAQFAQTTDLSANALNVNDIYFRNNGRTAYILDEGGSEIEQYTLTTAWDLSTATLVGVGDLAVLASLFEGFDFSPDGTKVYLARSGNNDILEYTFGTPWDITTITQTGSATPGLTLLLSVAVSPDGEYLYTTSFSGGDVVQQYQFGTPWDIDSGLTSVGTSIAPAANITPNGLQFTADGQTLYVTDNAGDQIITYSLSNAWDITTATTTAEVFAVSDETSVPDDLFINPQTSQLFVIDTNTGDVHTYDLGLATGGSLALGGGLTLASSTPESTTNTLYNSAGTLYWNGNAVGGDIVTNYIDSSAGIITETLPASTAAGLVRFYTNASTTNDAILAVQAGETLNGVTDGTFLFSNYSVGTQFRADEVTGGWVVSVVGASEVRTSNSYSLYDFDGGMAQTQNNYLRSQTGSTNLRVDVNTQVTWNQGTNLDTFQIPEGVWKVKVSMQTPAFNNFFPALGSFRFGNQGADGTQPTGVTILESHTEDNYDTGSGARTTSYEIYLDITQPVEGNWFYTGSNGGNTGNVYVEFERLDREEVVLAGMVEVQELGKKYLTWSTDQSSGNIGTGAVLSAVAHPDVETDLGTNPFTWDPANTRITVDPGSRVRITWNMPTYGGTGGGQATYGFRGDAAGAALSLPTGSLVVDGKNVNAPSSGNESGNTPAVIEFTPSATTDLFLYVPTSDSNQRVDGDIASIEMEMLPTATVVDPGDVTVETLPSFSAYLTANQSFDVSANVVFNTVEYDAGGNYNSSTGVFTAPSAGVYHFSAAARIDAASGGAPVDAGEVNITLQVNGQERLRGTDYVEVDDSVAPPFSNPVLSGDIALSAGDQVTVVATESHTGNSNVVGVTNEYMTYITGRKVATQSILVESDLVLEDTRDLIFDGTSVADGVSQNLTSLTWQQVVNDYESVTVSIRFGTDTYSSTLETSEIVEGGTLGGAFNSTTHYTVSSINFVDGNFTVNYSGGGTANVVRIYGNKAQKTVIRNDEFTGTAGSLVFSNGTSATEDNDNLFWDASEGDLHIGASSSAYATPGNFGGNGLVLANGTLCVDDGGLNCDDSARAAGTIYANVTSVTGVDLAENYPSDDDTLLPGELVVIDADKPSHIARSGESDDRETLLGIISTKPGLLLGGYGDKEFEGAHRAAVALAGRVPVLFSAENGAVVAGDKLIASASKPGYAMAACGPLFCGEARAVAVALEGFTETMSGDTDLVQAELVEEVEEVEKAIKDIEKNTDRLEATADAVSEEINEAVAEGDIAEMSELSAVAEEVSEELTEAIAIEEEAHELEETVEELTEEITDATGEGRLMAFVELADVRGTDATTETPEGLIGFLGDSASAVGGFISRQVSAVVGYFDTLFAREVRTETLCIGDTCVDEAALNELLQDNDVAPVEAPAPAAATPVVEEATEPEAVETEVEEVVEDDTTESESDVEVTEAVEEVAAAEPEEVAAEVAEEAEVVAAEEIEFVAEEAEEAVVTETAAVEPEAIEEEPPVVVEVATDVVE